MAHSAVMMGTGTRGYGRETSKTKTFGRIGLIAITGPTCNGKTVFGSLLQQFISPVNKMEDTIFVDMSEIIGWGKKLHGPLGESIGQLQHMMDRGEYLPDILAIPLLEQWLLKKVKDVAALKHLILAGAPRTQAQVKFIEQNFDHPLIMEIKTPKDIAKEMLFKRMKESQAVRADDLGGEQVFNKRWDEYHEHTVPALSSINGSLFIVDRRQPLLVRCTEVADHLEHLWKKGCCPLRKNEMLRRFRGRLKDPAHPAYQEIRTIEGHARPWKTQ